MSHIRFAVAVSILALSFFSGCTTVPPEVSYADPALFMEKDAQVYARLSGVAARDIASALGPERTGKFLGTVIATAERSANGGMKNDKSANPAVLDQKTLDMVLKRTNSAAIGISALDTPKPAIESVFLGEFPTGSLPLAMVMSADWTREAGGYVHKSGEFHLRSPAPGVLRLDSFAKAPPPAGAQTPGTHQGKTLPPRFKNKSMSDILVWMDRPSEVFGRSLFGEAFDLPVSGMLLSSVRSPSSGTTEVKYVTDFVFVMENAATAQAYRPIMRFLWAAMADRLFGEGMGSSFALTNEGDLYTVRGMQLSPAALANALAPSEGALVPVP